MIDLLALSPASVTAVNRAVYRRLVERNWRIELAIPSRAGLPGGVREADPVAANPFVSVAIATRISCSPRTAWKCGGPWSA